MKRKLSIAWLIVLSLVFSLGISACSPQTTPTTTPATYKDPAPESVIYSEAFGYIPLDQVVIVFEDGVDKATAEKKLKQIGGEVVGQMELINLYQLEMVFTTEAELTAVIDTALAMEGVEAAFPNVEVYGKDVEGVPCSPLKDAVFEDPDNASHYNTIGMENAWRIIKGSGVELNKVSVGVLDDAIYTGSDEFAGKAKVTGDTTKTPEKDDEGKVVFGGLSHGTMVTHVIGADPENSGMVGIAGVLEDNLNIDVKNLYDGKKDLQTAAADEDDITQATKTVNGVDYTYTVKALAYLQEQVKNGATVINCSYGPAEPNDNLEFLSKAYEKFFKKIHETNPDVVFVAAAGNEGNKNKSKGALNGKNYYPAGLKLPNVITVGALQNEGQRAYFSNFATVGGTAEVTLSAPGVEMLLGVDEDGKPIKASGTSFAAPQVTAAIALIQSINPKLNAAQVKDLLVATAAKDVTVIDQTTPIPEGMGAGVLRVDIAVLKAINDIREGQGEAPFTFNQLFNNTFVSLSASGGPLEYKVTAGIPSALSGSTDVKLEVSGGQHTIGGNSTKTVPAGGEVSWNLTLVDEPVFVRVTRLDSEGCAYMTLAKLEEINISGLYQGTSTVTAAKNDTLGSVNDMTFRIVQTKSGTATLIINEKSVEGSYNPETREFYMEYGFVWHLVFDSDGNTITAKGTMTSNETGEGYTQEITLDLKKTGD